MPGFCSGQALIGRLHSVFNDYAQEEKVNKRLLSLRGVNAGQVLLRVFARGTGGSSALSSVVFKMADGGRKCYRMSLNSRSTEYYILRTEVSFQAMEILSHNKPAYN